MLIYPELDITKEQVRLLSFQGRQSDDRLHFSLKTADLDTAEFNALSHTWDTSQLKTKPDGRFIRPLEWERKEERLFSVRVNDTDVNVTENLYECLQALTRTRSQMRPLFVDRVCINQTDEKEKTHQVGLMREVYSNAMEVIAWLNSLYPLWVFEKSLHSLQNDAALQNFFKDPDSATIQSSQKQKLEKSAREAAESTCEVLTSTYWSRQWIVQEAMLAKRLTLQIGDYNFDWEVLLNLVSRYSIWKGDVGIGTEDDPPLDPLHLPLHEKNPRVSWLIHRFGNLLSFKQQEMQRAGRYEPRRLSEVLVKFGGRDCTKQRDKIISLLGLAETDIPPTTSRSIGWLYLRVLYEGFMDFFRVDSTRRNKEWQLPNFMLAALVACGFEIWHTTILLITLRMLSLCKQPAKNRDFCIREVWFLQEHGVESITGLRATIRVRSIRRQYERKKRALAGAQKSGEVWDCRR